MEVEEMRTTRGFTLIELLVVISIIGILASLMLVSYSGVQKQTRDSQRKSDLAQYRNGLENFATANNSLYPSYTSAATAAGTLCPVLSPSYISGCPADPLGGSYVYYFQTSDGSGGGTANATTYVLWASLETGGYWQVCSNGKAGKSAAAPGGACSL